jgi:hypothetical protein
MKLEIHDVFSGNGYYKKCRFWDIHMVVVTLVGYRCIMSNGLAMAILINIWQEKILRTGSGLSRESCSRSVMESTNPS